MKIYENITELIGHTPLVKLQKTNDGNATILAKLEYFNPAGSIKDRAAFSMLQNAINEGKITKDTVIIEPTSGNTGIGLALCCAVMGYRLILTMPESMSEERKKMLKGYGAELVLTDKDLGMQGAVEKAYELAQKYENSFIPMQFSNKANVLAHELTTAEEIYADTDGKIDVLIAGIGTGGTIVGCAKTLKKYNPEIKIYGVEPSESPLLTQNHAGQHGIQGIGANFVPDILDVDYIDQIFTITTKDAINTAKLVAKKEGILCGISSGAALKLALTLSESGGFKDKTIVVILPDYGERYLSTALFED